MRRRHRHGRDRRGMRGRCVVAHRARLGEFGHGGCSNSTASGSSTPERARAAARRPASPSASCRRARRSGRARRSARARAARARSPTRSVRPDRAAAPARSGRADAARQPVFQQRGQMPAAQASRQVERRTLPLEVRAMRPRATSTTALALTSWASATVRRMAAAMAGRSPASCGPTSCTSTSGSPSLPLPASESCVKATAPPAMQARCADAALCSRSR